MAALVVYTWSGVGSVLPVAGVAPALTLILCGVTVVALLRGEPLRIAGETGFVLAAGAFLGVGLLSTLVSWFPGLALVRLLAWAKALVVAALIVQVVETPRDLRALAWWVFGAAVFSVGLGLLALVAGWSHRVSLLAGSVTMLRFSGLHADPNYGAAYFCAAVPAGLALVRVERGVRRLVAALGVPILVVGVFATLSRAAVFSLAVVAIGVLALELRSRRGAVGVGALIALGLVLAPPVYWQRLTTLGTLADAASQDWSVNLRLRALRTAWQLFAQHPLLGVGPGNFVERGAVGVPTRIVVHNAYVEVLVGTGLPGLAAFLGMLGAAARGLWPGRRPSARGGEADGLRTLRACFGLSLVSAMTSALFLSIMHRYLLWVPAAAGLAAARLMRGATTGTRRGHAA